MIITIILALCIWFVLPILLSSVIKGSNNRRALAMTCRIIGIVIIIWTIAKAIIAI